MDLLKEKIEKIIKDIINERKEFAYGGRGDEFYTQESDVQDILTTLCDELRGKVVYCPCANPEMSYFYKLLKENFSKFGLRGLYTTWMSNKVCYFDGQDEHISPIKSGRFQDTGEYFDLCDVVITNPPFSNGQPKEMLKMIMSRGKEYIMIADRALTQLQSVFDYVRNGSLRTLDKRIDTFDRPDGSKGGAPAAVYTNLKRNVPFFQTGVKYDPKIHRKFDDYDAIDCGDIEKGFRMIPDDYYGNIAVSSNGGGFLRYLNDDQFEIVDRLVRPKMNGVPKKRMIIRRKPQQGSIYSEALRRMKEELGII